MGQEQITQELKFHKNLLCCFNPCSNRSSLESQWPVCKRLFVVWIINQKLQSCSNRRQKSRRLLLWTTGHVFQEKLIWSDQQVASHFAFQILKQNFDFVHFSVIAFHQFLHTANGQCTAQTDTRAQMSKRSRNDFVLSSKKSIFFFFFEK